ncbi:MAG: ABC transporter ATP-binding protein [Phycisphaerales bacterium]|nr:ABC transporter ATP-binding protein [Phycisphaerales bacterium]
MTDETTPVLRAANVTFGFPNRPDFLKPLSLDMFAGQCWGIIGPNGAGKSTVLRLLAGLWTPTSGQILLEDRPLGNIPWHQRAKRTAFLPQQLAHDLTTSAGDIVLMGRHPYRRLGLFDNAADRKIAAQAMKSTQTIAFSDRPLRTLSGGEAQRVHIAAALAQQPSTFLLDEPTASLDLHYQLSIFELLQRLAIERHLLVVVVTHDINLAARFCTHVLLLNDGFEIAAGPPASVMTPEVLESVYNVELASARADHDTHPWLVPLKPKSMPDEAQEDDT